MGPSAQPRPSLDDVFHILSQVPRDKLLGLQRKLERLTAGPSGKLLQAMVLLALGREADARICLDALGDNWVAQYIHQTKLDAAGGRESREDLQPPQLDAGAMELLAKVYSLLAEEKLCSGDAADKACQDATETCQAATETCNDSKATRGDTLTSIPPKDQEKQVSAVSSDPGDRFLTLRSDVDAGCPPRASPNYVVSSPVQIGGHSALPDPQTLCSLETPSFPSHFEISTSPTAAFHTPPPSQERVPRPSRLREGSAGGDGWPGGDGASHGPQETSRASRASSQPGQNTDAQVPRPEQVLQLSSHDPSLPAPDTGVPTVGAPNQPVESSDVSSTVPAEPRAPEENTDKKQDGKPSFTGLPDSRAIVDTGPARMSMEESYPPAGIPSNAPSASFVTQSPPPPTYSFSPTLPPLWGVPPSPSYPPPHLSSHSADWHPPLKTVDPVPTSESDDAESKFFTFVVLHASEDEIVANRVKNLLENMGVPNGATLCEDFSIAGRSHMSCFQEAMENSAFIILLLTKNFQCNLCMFHMDTALMESIRNPNKHHSVIPFIPRENPLKQIPSTLSGLVSLDEKSPLFRNRVQKTFTSSSIKAKKDKWDQRRKQQLQQDRNQTLPDFSALNLSSRPQEPPSATWPQLPELSPQHWCPPAPNVPPATYPPPLIGHPTPAQMGPPPFQPLQLPPGHYDTTPGPGGIVIQHARMVQIGNHNVMRVETATAGARDSQEQEHQPELQQPSPALRHPHASFQP